MGKEAKVKWWSLDGEVGAIPQTPKPLDRGLRSAIFMLPTCKNETAIR